jgi:hypothetical protein
MQIAQSLEPAPAAAIAALGWDGEVDMAGAGMGWSRGTGILEERPDGGVVNGPDAGTSGRWPHQDWLWRPKPQVELIGRGLQADGSPRSRDWLGLEGHVRGSILHDPTPRVSQTKVACVVELRAEASRAAPPVCGEGSYPRPGDCAAHRTGGAIVVGTCDPRRDGRRDATPEADLGVVPSPPARSVSSVPRSRSAQSNEEWGHTRTVRRRRRTRCYVGHIKRIH